MRSIRVAVKLGAFLNREVVLKGERILVYRYPDP
jgi:hypothetical protein